MTGNGAPVGIATGGCQVQHDSRRGTGRHWIGQDPTVDLDVEGMGAGVGVDHIDRARSGAQSEGLLGERRPDRIQLDGSLCGAATTPLATPRPGVPSSVLKPLTET